MPTGRLDELSLRFCGYIVANRAASASKRALLRPIRSLKDAEIAPGGTSSAIREVPSASRNSRRIGRVVISAIAAPSGGRSYAVVGNPTSDNGVVASEIAVNGDL